MLASVDHIVDLALNIPQLLLLSLQLEWLLKLSNLTIERVDFLDVGRSLHPQLVVVPDQLLDLILESLSVESLQLILKTGAFEADGTKTIMPVERRISACAKRGRI